MLISKSNKFIFFKPMKTAGTTVEYAFALTYPLGDEDICTGNTEGNDLYGNWAKNMEAYYYLDKGVGEHYGPTQMLKVIPGLNLDNFKKYTIIRNPWDLLVSYYWYIHANHSYYSFDPECEPLPGDSFEAIREKFVTWSNRSYFVSIFKTNLDGYLETPYETLARINEPMAEKADIHIEFENLTEDLAKKANISCVLPRFKGAFRKTPQHYREYYANSLLLARKLALCFPYTISSGKYEF